MKSCANCNCSVHDDSTVCPKCGKEFLNPVPDKPHSTLFTELKGDKGGKIILSIIIFIAFSVVTALIVCIIAKGTPKYLIGEYFDAIVTTDGQAMSEIMASEYKLFFHIDDEENMVEALEHVSEYELEDLEDSYGKNINFGFKVTHSEKLDDQEINDIQKSYKNYNELKDVEITDAVEYEFDIRVKGDDKSDTGEGYAMMVKENKKWKLLFIEYEF